MRLVAITLLMISCSHQKSLLRPQGLTRMEIEQSNYVKPEFFVSKLSIEENFSRAQQLEARAPASLESETQDNLSNRQVYFLGLYYQYKKLTKILTKEDKLNFCPSFHQILLDNQSVGEINMSSNHVDLDWGHLKKNQKELIYFPHMAMPFSAEKDLYTALRENNWKDTEQLTRQGLDYFYHQSKEEVMSLCERGVSPGYYIFENMVRYYKQQGKFQSGTLAFKALVKIPIIANMLVIDSLTNDQIAHNLSRFEILPLERSNSIWFRHYLQTIKQQRKKVVAKLKGKSKDTELSLNRSYPSLKLFDNRFLKNK